MSIFKHKTKWLELFKLSVPVDPTRYLTYSRNALQQIEARFFEEIENWVKIEMLYNSEQEAYQEVPPLFTITSNNVLVLRPSRAPKAIASADDAIWTPASNWLTIFTTLAKRNKVYPNDRYLCKHCKMKTCQAIGMVNYLPAPHPPLII